MLFIVEGFMKPVNCCRTSF